MNGGTISENSVIGGSNGGGGGVDLSGSAGDIHLTFTMTGGNITKNTAAAGGGGGISKSGWGNVIISGGTIAGNSARQGGGVHIRDSGTFDKKAGGGIIYGSNGGENANTVTIATDPANAVYVWERGGVHRVTTVEANERLYYHASGGSMTTEGNWIQH
jgi:hypothetical protein